MGTAQRGVVGGIILVVVVLVALFLRDDEPAPTAEGLTITWANSEDGPACVYDEAAGEVRAELSVTGRVTEPTTVMATVATYSDENTSKEIGQQSRSVEVDGVVMLTFDIVIPVDKAPHVDEDGVAACSLDSSY